MKVLSSIVVPMFKIPIKRKEVNTIIKVVHGIQFKENMRLISNTKSSIQKQLIGNLGEVIAVSVLQSEGITHLHILRGASCHKTPFDILIGKDLASVAKSNFHLDALQQQSTSLLEVKSSTMKSNMIVLSLRQSTVIKNYPIPQVIISVQNINQQDQYEVHIGVFHPQKVYTEGQTLVQGQLLEANIEPISFLRAFLPVYCFNEEAIKSTMKYERV